MADPDGQDGTSTIQDAGERPQPPELRVHGRDDPRLRAELIARLQHMLVIPETMAPPRWAVAHFRDARGHLVGGTVGLTTGLWLSIELLWVDPARRGGGVGAALVGALEKEAVARGCRGAHVQTSSNAARGFYERIGYRTMLTMEEAEPDFARHTLQRRFPGRVPPPVVDGHLGLRA